MPQKSRIWTHFEKTNKTTAKCLVCHIPVKSAGNTTNLFKHMRLKHWSIFESEYNQKDKDDDSLQQKIDDLVNEVNSYKDGDLSRCLDNKIAWWIVWNSHPYRVVEQPGFKEMLKSCNKNYTPPGKNKIQRIITNLYDVKSNQLKIFFSELKWFSITSDGWKDVCNQTSYIGVTVHFIMNYELLSICIKADHFKSESTSERIEQSLRNALLEFELPLEKLVCITTDGAANFVKAAKSVGSHLHCVAHRINLIVQEALDNTIVVSNLVHKVRALITAFKQSSVLMDALCQSREDNGESSLKLIQDVATRWNSTYMMLERYITLHNDVSFVLVRHSKRDIDIDDSGIICLKEVCMVLQPFYDLTKDISGENYITISRIIPLVSSVKILLQKLKLTTPAKALLSNVLSSIDKRFGGIEKNKLLSIATLLDPRFKKLAFSSTADCSLQVSELNEMLIGVELSQQILPEEDFNTESIWASYDRKVRSHSNPASGMHNGLKHFLESDVIARHENPMEFWSKNKQNWPQLHNLAIKYLCVQATSVPCERLFSKTGAIITEKRNRIKPKNVNILSFLDSLPKSMI